MAWDLGRFDWRTFRLDRLAEPRPAGARAVPRHLPADDAAAFVRSSLDNVPWRHRVEVLIDAPADVVRQRIGPWGTLEARDRRDAGSIMTPIPSTGRCWPWATRQPTSR